MAVTYYDPADTTILVGTTYITGLGEDMISAEKDEEHFSTEVGAQGDVVENETNNPLGTITITVQTTSPQKGFLMDLAKSGEHLPVWCTNKGIGERFGGTNARVKKYADIEHGTEAGTREFEIQIFDYTVDNI